MLKGDELIQNDQTFADKLNYFIKHPFSNLERKKNA